MQKFVLWALLALMAVFTTLSIVSFFTFEKTKKLYKECYKRFRINEEELMNALSCRVEAVKQVMDIASLSGTNANLLYSKIQHYINAPHHGTNLAKNMTIVANLLCYGLADYLRDNYPKLSENDIEICALLALGFPAHSIENMYNYSNTNSYYNRRARIRKKINLHETTNLEPTLLAIIKELKEQREKEIKYFEPKSDNLTKFAKDYLTEFVETIKQYLYGNK